MKKFIAALALTALAIPASATPVRLVVEPYEQMVQVPGLEYLGPSRISTVQHCAKIEALDWQNLITDSDFDTFEGCLIEHT